MSWGQQYHILISINYKLVNRLQHIVNQPIDHNRLRSNPPPAYDSFTIVGHHLLTKHIRQSLIATNPTKAIVQTSPGLQVTTDSESIHAWAGSACIPSVAWHYLFRRYYHRTPIPKRCIPMYEKRINEF